MGAAIGGSANYLMVRTITRQADRFFRNLPYNSEQESDSIMLSSREDPPARSDTSSGLAGSRKDAEQLLRGLVGSTIETYSGMPNQVIKVEPPHVLVGTRKSPRGEPVPIQWVQDGLDLLKEEGEVEVNVATLGHRSAFVAAALLTLPNAQRATNPSRVVLVEDSLRDIDH